jgi:hypothetical protein
MTEHTPRGYVSVEISIVILFFIFELCDQQFTPICEVKYGVKR